MKYFKKLKVGISMAMLGAMMLSTTAHAHPNIPQMQVNARDGGYTQPLKSSNDQSYHHPVSNDDRINYQLHCQVYRYQIENDYLNVFKDGTIRKKALEFIDQGYTVIDLAATANLINEGLLCSQTRLFNQGFMAIDNIYNSTYTYYYCKCSQSDFKNYENLVVNRVWQNDSNPDKHLTAYSRYIEGVHFDSISYHADTQILEVMHINLRK